MMKQALLVFCLAMVLALPSSATTNPHDVSALKALQEAWSPALDRWNGSDPCNGMWAGVGCDASNTSVIKLSLPSMNLSGPLPATIANLVNLSVLDLSYNRNLTGDLPLELFSLTNLSHLILQKCGFSGTISPAFGNLTALQYLSLNDNHLTGELPESIGQLSELLWLDVSNNYLVGALPSTLGNLNKAEHLHFQQNMLTGSIPKNMFSSQMAVSVLLLHNNSLGGPLPEEIGDLRSLDILRLDFNNFTSMPASMSNLTGLTTMQLDHNGFKDSLADLTNLTKLRILDVSHNNFMANVMPSWLSSLPSLKYLAMEASNLQGTVPPSVFALSDLGSVFLGYNSLNGSLDLGSAGPSLAQVDLPGNGITALITGNFSGILNLQGNPICKDKGDAACTPQ